MSYCLLAVADRTSVENPDSSTTTTIIDLASSDDEIVTDNEVLSQPQATSTLIMVSPKQKKKQKTIKESFSQEYNPKGHQHKRLTEAVANFLAKDALPFYLVERPGFVNLLKEFEPRCVLCSNGQNSPNQLVELLS